MAIKALYGLLHVSIINNNNNNNNELKKKLLQNGLEVSCPSERRLCKERERDRQIGEF
jgi:hypothetical protein